MQIEIDSSKCQGHASCVLICPEVFTLSDDGFGVVSNPDPAAEVMSSAYSAADNCPERAITIND